MLLYTAITSLLTGAGAWDYQSGLGYGIFGSPEQIDAFEAAQAHPNATTSVFVGLNHINVTFRVNVSELALDTTLPGVDISDPSAVVTTYDVNAPEGSSLQAVFGTTNNSCFSVTGTVVSASHYKGDGDCVSALGQDCVDALLQASFRCDIPFIPPQACQMATKDSADWGSWTILPFNQSVRSYDIFSRQSGLIPATQATSQFKSEVEGLQVAVFRVGESVVPICAQVSAASLRVLAVATHWVLLLMASVSYLSMT